MAATAAPSAGSAIDIPHLLRPRPLRSAREILPISVRVSLERQDPGEEFDFSDVFGHIQTAHDQLQTNGCEASGQIQAGPPVNTSDIVSAAEHLASWAPPESISEGQPLVINHRSHSLVGPAVTPRHSFSHQSGRLSIPDHKVEGTSKASSVEEGWEDGEEVKRGFGDKEAEHVEAVVVHTAEVLAMGLSDSSGESSGDDESPVKSIADMDKAGSGLIKEATHAARNGAPFEKKLGPTDFELLRVVGQGAFGKVFQVKKKDTGEILAMKVMRKDKIMERNHSDYMKAERDILTKAVHPFIVQLQYSFQTKTKLYLLLDFINGGHLFFQLYRQGTFSEELAKIYSAEIVLAVAHLHKMGIMHRDLKPENILLDSEGHVKLTDFGLAKEVCENDKSNSLCGTMEYMAPEIILAKGHGCAADWWSVGILLYEMLTGQPPFAHNNRQKLQQKIIKDKIKFPQYLTSEANNLLKGLLQKDPARRFGSGPMGSEDIKGHKWFKGVNWKKLEAREIQPKFRPTVNGKHCTANFDEMWTSMPVQDSPAGTPTSDGIELLTLHGYTYSAPRQWLPTVDSDSQGEDSDTNTDTDDE